jgi:hypothetical protein
MHISREADCARLGHPAGVRREGVRHGVPNGHPGPGQRRGLRLGLRFGHYRARNSGLGGR